MNNYYKKRENGGSHSLTHKSIMHSRQRSHKRRQRKIKRRISKIFCRKYKNQKNPVNILQKSDNHPHLFRRFIISKCENNSNNNNKLELKNPVNFDLNREIITNNNNKEFKPGFINISSNNRNINENNNISAQNFSMNPLNEISYERFEALAIETIFDSSRNTPSLRETFNANEIFLSSNESPSNILPTLINTNINLENRSNEPYLINDDRSSAISNVRNNNDLNFFRNENSHEHNNINSNNTVNNNADNRNDNNIHIRLNRIRRRVNTLRGVLINLFSGYNPRVERNLLRTIKRRLQKIKYNDNKDSICAICQEIFHRGKNIYKLNCSHIFHVRCLNEELKRRLKCPICRAPIK